MSPLFWLCAPAILVGEAALLMDFGGRVFGSYVRTPVRMALAMAAQTAFGLGQILPLLLYAADPAAPLNRNLLLFTAGIGIVLGFHFLRSPRGGIRRIPVPAEDQDRRELAPGIFLREIRLDMAGLPKGVETLSLLILTDLHANSKASADLLRAALKALDGPEPDLAVFLGDFGERPALHREIIQALGSLPAWYGAFAVRGNHDLEGGRGEGLEALLGETPIRLLPNRAVRLDPPGVTILGFEHPWNAEPVAPFEAGGFLLALTHTPDNVKKLARMGAGLILAGHTHGGQFSVPGLGPLLVPCRLGRFLNEGFFAFEGAILYVARGIGYAPGRLGQYGEIVRLVLRRGGGMNSG